MLRKMKNKPIWYKLWATTAGIAAFYCVIDFFFFDERSVLFPTINLYTIASVLLDMLIFPVDQQPIDAKQ